MARRRRLDQPARLLLIATAFLVVGGLLMVYSASSVTDYVRYGDSAYHLRKQAVFAGVGLIALVALSFWDFKGRRGHQPLATPKRVAWFVWGVTLLALIAVEIAGVSGGGATMSLKIGSLYVQPSEYAKLGCLLMVAVLLVERDRGQMSTGTFLLWLGGVLGPVVTLIMLQPDMGGAVSLLLGVAMLLWLGGIKGRWMALAAAGGLAIAALLVAIAPYRMERITAFLHPWADPTDTGYQLIQSLYALGSGGLFGVGLGLSKQKVFYLPLAHNDFIFAVIGEEFGFMGTLAVVAAFLLFAYAGIRIALECRDSFGRLLAGGLTAMIAMQALMNMAAVTGLMPITGVTLPFVSSGGTSLTLTMACVGLIIAVSRYGGTSKVRLVRGKTIRGPKEDSIVRGSQDRANTAERRRNGGTHLSSLDGGGASSRRRA